MLSQNYTLPEGFVGFVAQVNQPNTSVSRVPLQLKRPRSASAANNTSASVDVKRRRMSPRKAAQQARARPAFSMDSDDEDANEAALHHDPVQWKAGVQQTHEEVVTMAEPEAPEHVEAEEQDEDRAECPVKHIPESSYVQLQPVGTFEQFTI